MSERRQRAREIVAAAQANPEQFYKADERLERGLLRSQLRFLRQFLALGNLVELRVQRR